MTPVDEVTSTVLKMKSIQIKRCSFEKNVDSVKNTELQLNINREIFESTTSTDSMVSLTATVSNNDKEFEAIVVCQGIFSVDEAVEDVNVRNALIKRNAVAILFPYIRSQMTLLTTVPGFSPIILPAINISSVLDKIEEEQQNSKEPK